MKSFLLKKSVCYYLTNKIKKNIQDFSLSKSYSMTSLSSETNPLTSPSDSRKPFKFYRNADKKVCDNHSFRVLIKNHSRNLKTFEIKQYRLPFPNSSDNNILQEEILRSLRKILKQNKSLSTLNFFIHGTKPFYTESLLSDLKNLRSLSTLNLRFLHPESVSLQICESFTCCLRSLKRLVNIASNFYERTQITKDSQKDLRSFRHLSCLRALNALSTGFTWSTVLNDKSVCFFSSHLARLTSLKSLSLKLSKRRAITEKVFCLLSKNIGKLSLLEALHLQFGYAKNLNSSTLRGLFENLKDLMHFKELSLSGVEKLDCRFFIDGLALLDPSKLNKLSIKFGFTISDSQLLQFFGLLQKFSSLTHLNLELDSCEEITSQSFSNFPLCPINLQNLSLKITYLCDNSDISSILHLTSLYLQKLKNLTSFRINITAYNGVSDSIVQEILSSLLNSPNLANLCLNFGKCQSIQGESLENLAQFLQKFPTLKDLELNFERIKNLTNQAVMNFFPILESLQNLKKLSLNFSDCPEVNGDCFGELMKSLGFLSFLNTISITWGKLFGKDKIERYRELTEFLGNMKALKEISLDFCPFKRNEIDEKIQCLVRKYSSKKFIL